MQLFRIQKYTISSYYQRICWFIINDPKYIASCIKPDLIWFGAGNIHGLTIEKCQVLENRNEILFPNLNAFEKWSEKARIFNSPPLKLSRSTFPPLQILFSNFLLLLEKVSEWRKRVRCEVRSWTAARNLHLFFPNSSINDGEKSNFINLDG